mgnify:CR=1 FL=1
MKGIYKLLIAIIKGNGGFLVRQARGDHEIWSCNGIQETVDRGITSRYLANKILKTLKIDDRL